MTRILRVTGAVGAITRLFSYAFLLPLGISLVYDPYEMHRIGLALPRATLVFAGCFAFTWLLGTAMRRAERAELPSRDSDAYLTVGVGWIILCLVGMIPFLMDRVLRSPVDAFFETMSGITTTGATVIPVLEDIDPSILMWRAFLQFIGGMGIIVLSVAVISKLTQGGLQMIQAEAPGPSVSRIAPRLAQTARILWGVYLAMAAILFALLFVVMLRHGMGLHQTFYEALLHTFTTISTGGFSNHTASIAFFDDWVLEAIIIAFMLVSGTNYTLHYHLLRGQARPLWKDPEWRFFMGTFALMALLMTGILWRAGVAVGQALRDASFTSASLITSTGFGTADFDQWPALLKMLLLLLMITGATAGSTGGGMKHIRILLIFKLIRREIVRILHPKAVVPIRLGGREIKSRTLLATVAFFGAFIGIWLFGALALMFMDPAFGSPIDAASASISALSNMGPGLGVVGPTQNYAALTSPSKLLLAMEMWIGRLEVFTALVVFTPEAWRH